MGETCSMFNLHQVSPESVSPASFFNRMGITFGWGEVAFEQLWGVVEGRMVVQDGGCGVNGYKYDGQVLSRDNGCPRIEEGMIKTSFLQRKIVL